VEQALDREGGELTGSTLRDGDKERQDGIAAAPGFVLFCLHRLSSVKPALKMRDNPDLTGMMLAVNTSYVIGVAMQ
jgi:hypothetical protein